MGWGVVLTPGPADAIGKVSEGVGVKREEEGKGVEGWGVVLTPVLLMLSGR